MKPATTLRVASGVALLQYVAHAFLFLNAVPHGAEATAAVEAMKSNHFVVTGLARSYWDYYQGYGFMVIVTGVMEVGLLWQLASLAKTDAGRVRPAIGIILAAIVAHAVLAVRYFSVTPIAPDVLVAVCLGWTLFASRTRSQASAQTGAVAGAG